MDKDQKANNKLKKRHLQGKCTSGEVCSLSELSFISFRLTNAAFSTCFIMLKATSFLGVHVKNKRKRVSELAGTQDFVDEKLVALFHLSQLLMRHQSLPLQRLREGQWRAWGICSAAVGAKE